MHNPLFHGDSRSHSANQRALVVGKFATALCALGTLGFTSVVTAGAQTSSQNTQAVDAVADLATKIAQLTAERDARQNDLAVKREAVNKALVDLTMARAGHDEALAQVAATNQAHEKAKTQLESATSAGNKFGEIMYKQGATPGALSGLAATGGLKDAALRRELLSVAGMRHAKIVEELTSSQAQAATAAAEADAALQNAHTVRDQASAALTSAQQSVREVSGQVESMRKEQLALEKELEQARAQVTDTPQSADPVRSDADILKLRNEAQRRLAAQPELMTPIAKMGDVLPPHVDFSEIPDIDPKAIANALDKIPTEKIDAFGAQVLKAFRAGIPSSSSGSLGKSPRDFLRIDLGSLNGSTGSGDSIEGSLGSGSLGSAGIAGSLGSAGARIENGRLNLNLDKRLLGAADDIAVAPYSETSTTPQSTTANENSTDPTTEATSAEPSPTTSVQPTTSTRRSSTTRSAPSQTTTYADDPNWDGGTDSKIGNFVNPAAMIETVIDRAMSQLGVRYSWGGGNVNGPTKGIRDYGTGDYYGDYLNEGFDCSGLMIYAFAPAGYALPHYTGYQYKFEKHYPVAQMKRGDLLFWGTNASQHVALYLGDGKMIEAPQSGSVVKISPVRWGGMTPDVVRLIE